MALLPRRDVAGSSREQARLLRTIQRADRDIDSLVYDLYGLSAQDVKRVEAAFEESKGNTAS
jgi:hypothetical protein